jgi:hypothetical protein
MDATRDDYPDVTAAFDFKRSPILRCGHIIQAGMVAGDVK